ncbi:hypothetical protein TFLX_00928 [Thermoflexales bacterium]|nr:hypothetical protein TFLX_00928 [Thermoflexales bacterium]
MTSNPHKPKYWRPSTFASPTRLQTPPSHKQRLAYIREWVISRHVHDSELLTNPPRSTKKYSFEWLEQETTTYVSESPYGKVVIREERSKKPFSYGATSSYKPWIEDPSGARYNCLEKFIDFVDAEDWLQDALNRLDDPRISEWFLECIHFTLDVCQHVLPDTSDQLHHERINYLMDWFDESLP